MKFKVGDKVKSVNLLCKNEVGEIIDIHNRGVPYQVQFPTEIFWKAEQNLELISRRAEPQAASVEPAIRTFETGATRDTVAGKLSYLKALSPEVLETYVMYLDKHRSQPDGSMRAFDNWKHGIDKWVYLDSLLRHNHTVWMLMLGFEATDNHGPVTLFDSLMATIFNASGLAYELLIEEGKAKRPGSLDRTKPTPGGY